MARYKVQQQDWKHWPKVIVVEQWNEYGLAFGRYVPDKGTCYMEHLWSDDIDGVCWWCKACDKPAFTHGDFPPDYCPNCGRRVVGE